MDKLGSKLGELIALFNREHEAAKAGNKAAGMRARSCTNEITKVCKEYRAASVEHFKQ